MQGLQQLRQAASQPPLAARWPLRFAGQAFGSMESRLFELAQEQLVRAGAPGLLQLQSAGDGLNAVIELAAPTLSDGLAQLAQALRQGRLTGGWRDELLAVLDASGQRIGVVERGVCRVLGIATEAVHLVGWSHDGRVWVQQRSMSKATDPGMWDTLMGGMISAQDTVETALVRETWEEAGLRLEQLPAPIYGGIVQQQRPSFDGPGAYVIEHAHWYHINLPQGVVPANQDGEVAQFACLSRHEVEAGVRAGQYTLEASLILIDALGIGPD